MFLEIILHAQVLDLLTFQTPKFSANHINICFWDSIAKVVILHPAFEMLKGVNEKRCKIVIHLLYLLVIERFIKKSFI